MDSSKLNKLILVASTSAVTVAGLIYLIKKINANDNEKHPHPHPPSIPNNSFLFGTTDLVDSVTKGRFAYYLFEQHKALGKVYRVSAYGKEQYLIADSDEIHRILNSASEFYRDEDAQKSFKSIADSALFLLPTGDQGEQWHRHRKLLSYGFSQTHLNHGFEQALGFAKEISDFWLSLNGQAFNLQYAMSCLALDIIGRVVFSQNMGAIDAFKESGTTESERYDLLNALGPIISRRRTFPSWLWGYMGIAPAQVEEKIEPIRRLALNVLKEKDTCCSKLDKDMDLLDRLLAKDNQGGDKFAMNEIMDEIFGFYLAGHGTTSGTMTFIILCLIQHPEVKSKLIAELEHELKGAAPSIQDLSNLQYLDAVVKETLRLYPIASTVERRNVNETIVGGYTIPKNSVLRLNIYGMQHGSWTWGDDSEKFSPERFMDAAYPKHGWQPFGSGANVCIGMRMALLEIKAVLVIILPRFEFELVPGQNLIPQSEALLRFEQGLYVKAKPRM